MAQSTVYERWLATEGVPVVRGLAAENLFDQLPLEPWPRKGVPGCFVKLEGSANSDDAYVVEIPPGGHENPEHHLFDELIFILEGRGSCVVWLPSGPRTQFEWHEGSLFAVPLNAHHQMFNGSGTKPARYLAVTMAPIMMNLLHDIRFIFDCPSEFADRFRGEDQFSGEGAFVGEAPAFPGRVWQAAFIPSVPELPLHARTSRGRGESNVMLEFGDNAMGAHVSAFPVGTYKRAHRHAAGSHILILDGEGYSLLWPEGSRPQQVPWRRGSLLVPPEQWYHQHFNVGPVPARYLALRCNSLMFPALRSGELPAEAGETRSSRRSIAYEDQDPAIHRLFVEECARRGVTPRM